jgi:hypothetical protein
MMSPSKPIPRPLSHLVNGNKDPLLIGKSWPMSPPKARKLLMKNPRTMKSKVKQVDMMMMMTTMRDLLGK